MLCCGKGILDLIAFLNLSGLAVEMVVVAPESQYLARLGKR